MSELRFFDELGAELERVATARRGSRRPAPGTIAAGLATAVALSVVALAITSLRHRPAPSRPTVSQANEPGARGLLAALAILRRPQTSADRGVGVRLCCGTPAGGTGPGLTRAEGPEITSLTRLAAILRGARVYIVVRKPVSILPNGDPPLWSPRLGDQVGIDFATRDAASGGLRVPAAGLNGGSVDVIGLAGPRYAIGIVPDGVARVRWVFRGGRVVYPRVANNLAVARAPGIGDPPTSVTWYAAGGRVIPTSHKALQVARLAQLLAIERQALARERLLRRYLRYRNKTAPALLADFGVLTENGTVRGTDVSVLADGLSDVPQPFLELVNPSRPVRLDLHDVRQVFASRLGVTLWVVPGAAGLCLITGTQPGFREVCNTNLARLESEGLSMVVTDYGDNVDYRAGIVPKSVRFVRLRTTSGGSRTVFVRGGVFFTPEKGLVPRYASRWSTK